MLVPDTFEFGQIIKPLHFGFHSHSGSNFYNSLYEIRSEISKIQVSTIYINFKALQQTTDSI